MQAAILKGPGLLCVEERAEPACPPGGLLVKTGVCAICSVDARMFNRGQRALVYPRIPGHEAAGTVVESLDQSGRIKAGDRVQVFPGVSCGECTNCRRGADNHCEKLKIMGFSYDGAFAEYFTVPAASVKGGGVNLIPANVSLAEAALVEPLASCLNGQQAAAVKPGDRVLILGAGPIGLLHARLAAHQKAGQIILAERRPERLNIPPGIPVDRLIDTSKEDLVAASRHTAGGGVDVIITACSGIELTTLPGCLNAGGCLCLFSGFAAESSGIQWDANLIHYRELRLVGAYGSTSAQNTLALGLIASGEIVVADLITRQISLSQIRPGLEGVAGCRGLKTIINF